MPGAEGIKMSRALSLTYRNRCGGADRPMMAPADKSSTEGGLALQMPQVLLEHM